jgi:hypothetical protein
MAKGLFIAWSSPVNDETDAAFNQWYEGTHVPELRALIPSITAVNRYRTADVPGGLQPPYRYLAVYELDSEDVAAAQAALAAAGAEGRITFTDTMDLTQPIAIQWYQGIS